nr:hypothetical protein [Tanacetum cinerariifolium]
MRLVKGIIDFDNGVIIVYPEPDPFEEDYEKTKKSPDDWNQLLDFNFDDIPKFGEELPLFVCKMRKSNQNKKRSMENLSLFYQDIGTSLLAGGHLTQEEVAKEALAIRISQKFALLEEVEVLQRIKGEALKEKDDPGAFIFPIRLEGRVNENALADMPYRIYETLGREEMKKVDRGITMINHTHTKAMGMLNNVFCQVGVTTIISKFLILDIPIDRHALIVVGRGFLYTIGSILNIIEKLFSTFDGICHQTFRAARFDVLRTAKSDSDNEEEYQIKRNKFGALIYGPKPEPYLNCKDLADRSLAIQTVTNPFRKISVWKKVVSFFNSLPVPLKQVNWNRTVAMGCDGEIDDMLRIKLREAGSNKEIFTFVAWIRAFNINEPIYVELYHEFYSTYEFDEACADDELQTKKIMKFRLGGRAHSLTLLKFARRLGLYQAVKLDEEGFNVYFKGGAGTQQESQICCGQFISKIARKSRALTNDVLRSLSALIYCRYLDTATLRDLIDSNGKLIPKDPQPGVPRVGIPRPPRASMQDLYDRMGRMEIRQEAIERMEYRQSYPWDSIPHISSSMIRRMSSVEMTQVDFVTALFRSRVF